MFFKRRRYYFWLIQAYTKKWKKTIVTSLILGIIFSFSAIIAFHFYLKPLFERKVIKVGYVGLYTPKSIPEKILYDVSYGLTYVNTDGSIIPDAAEKWDVKDNGKKYIFYIKKGLKFGNGVELTSHTLPLSFKNVDKREIDTYTVQYTLKSPYAPFLVTVSKPMFINGYSGLGEYTLSKIDLASGFVKSFSLEKKSDLRVRKIIYFYPTEEALKTAYMLGEVDQISGITNLVLNNKNLQSWKRIKIEKKVNYEKMVTLFYNNNDSELSNKKLRQALTYALPSEFEKGERAYSPIPVNSIYFQKSPNYSFTDFEIAKTLFDSAKPPKGRVFEITTSPELKDVALVVQKAWDTLGFKTKIVVVDEVPDQFQILLYQFTLPKDPDQYTLWHSQGVNNIANYRKNKRIDKLLEDGRVTVDLEKRKTIYADFQKYLIDDAPASFLYFPYEYEVKKM